MRTLTIAAAAIATALLLTGCAAGEASPAPTVAEAARTIPSETAAQATPEPEPLVATPLESPKYDDDDARFLGELAAAYERRSGNFQTQIPDATDEQLIAAAHRACDQLPSIGFDTTLAQVIEGETPNGLGTYTDSAIIAAVAEQVYCPTD